MGEMPAGQSGSDPGLPDGSGRLVSWWRKSALTLPGWIFPLLVILITGLLGRDPQNQELVCWWLGLVGGVVVYQLIFIAIEPAPYAKKLASALAVVAALVAAQLLLHQVGHGVLSS